MNWRKTFAASTTMLFFLYLIVSADQVLARSTPYSAGETLNPDCGWFGECRKHSPVHMDWIHQHHYTGYNYEWCLEWQCNSSYTRRHRHNHSLNRGLDCVRGHKRKLCAKQFPIILGQCQWISWLGNRCTIEHVARKRFNFSHTPLC